MAEAHEGVFYAAGTHPMSAADEPLATVDELVGAGPTIPKFVGIGETGLDYHYTADTQGRAAGQPAPAYRGGAADRAAADHPCPRRR